MFSWIGSEKWEADTVDFTCPTLFYLDVAEDTSLMYNKCWHSSISQYSHTQANVRQHNLNLYFKDSSSYLYYINEIKYQLHIFKIIFVL